MDEEGRKMPIYEYECEQCHKVEEAWQKLSEPPLTTCRHCSGSLHKLVSQSTFHLKGSGWYVTDYNGKSGDTAKENSKPEAPKTTDSKSSADSGKSDTQKSS